jgi:2-amino-4-hydroxy-6-hydroxymethyldihydropteridine diphosphokinase
MSAFADDPLAPRTTVYVGLGSNLAQPVLQLQRAISRLDEIPRARLTRLSSFYETEPEGIKEQPNFVNAVAEMQTTLSPQDFFAALSAIEKAHHRVRLEKGGPRTLDLDLLIYGDVILTDPALMVPHPRMHERAFVLIPLHEISQDLYIPGRGYVKDCLVLTDGHGVRKITEVAVGIEASSAADRAAPR